MVDYSCAFCRIIRKEVPESRVYEDDQTLAFMDIRPASEGHTLVIPKKHYETVLDMAEEEVAYLHKISKRVAVAVKKGMKADGISIIQQNGRAAGQDIMHVHVHVIPRFEGQKLPRFEEITEANRTRLDEIAENLRNCIQIQNKR
jgi:histidine triad (HIT) family protein